MKIEGEFNTVVGTPTLLMLPARRYAMKVFKEDFVITIPRKGLYKDLDPKFFNEESGGFDILRSNEDNTKEVLFIPSLSKVLFATSQYPDLDNDQAFAPIDLVIKEDTIDIIGNIIQMTKENKEN
jgi:hypothetical protein